MGCTSPTARRDVRLGPFGSGPRCLEPAPLPLAEGQGLYRLDRDGRPRPGPAVDREQADEASRTFRLDDGARLANGSPVTARSFVEAWNAARDDPCSPARWLLGPIESADASGTKAATLTLRLARPVPDLAERLSHPALGLGGAGPFSNKAGLDVRRLDDEPALLLRLGEADAAVLYGASATPFVDGDLPALVAERAGGWDRTYSLWLNRESTAMATADRRAAVARGVDAAAMARDLFGARAGVALSLLDPDLRQGPPASSPSRSRPSAALLFDPADGIAETIAARIRADLLEAGCRVRLEPAADSFAYATRLSEGSFDLALIVHRDATPDPLLRLGLTLSSLAGPAADALGAIDLATRQAAAVSRSIEAERIERTLIEQYRLAPLLRVEAWLVRDERLRGLDADAWLRLTLSRARWTR